MTDYTDLEIGLHRRDAGSYAVEMRFSRPDSETDNRLLSATPTAQFDFDALLQHSLDDARYGQLLTDSLFADAELQGAFDKAHTIAQAYDPPLPLRIRLFIGPTAPELHSLRWETLRDPRPQADGTLLTSEHIRFSRYLTSQDWRPVRLRPQADLQALVVIANPGNLTDYQPGGQPLAVVDVAGELDRARSGLGGIELKALDSGGQAGLTNLAHHLRDGYDILYLVCHGAIIKGTPHLWLEKESGDADVVNGDNLVTRLKELQERPRLVVLASCQSAGSGVEARSGDEGALAALGPRLAEAGIPAVLAMQGNITMQTVAQFMPTFFSELQRDGQIDRAMAAARGAVRDRPDWWMPVLFMRLKSGRLWYTPGFAGEKGGLEKWPALIRNIKRGRATPILGMGLTESLLGSTREIAQRWADTYHFPMAPHDREDLPQVAQYLAINQDYIFPRDELIEYLRQEMLARYGPELPADLHQAELNALITAVGTLHRERNPVDPYRILADLPLPIYITTDASNLLETALAATGDKAPQVEFCRWNNETEFLPSIYDDDPDYRPTVERPLVYQLFGRLDELDSVVLTEDDYFDYLIGVTSNKDLIPGIVRRNLVDTALLFLGFRLDDWDFRVLFRSIMSREGGRRRSRYAHVAVQINPEEGRIQDPERARHYLESYFQDADVSIYWGSAEDFIRELKQQWDKEAQSS